MGDAVRKMWVTVCRRADVRIEGARVEDCGIVIGAKVQTVDEKRV
jgi:hypothetical protein